MQKLILKIFILLHLSAAIASAADFSFGTFVDAQDGNSAAPRSAKIDEDKFVVCYAYGTAGRCEVGSISGTTITFGTASAFDSDIIPSSSVSDIWAPGVCQISDNKFAISYTDDGVGSDDDGYTTVATVSGTTLSSYGTAYKFKDGAVQSAWYTNCAGISDEKYVIVFKDSTDSSKGKAVVCTATGTTNPTCGSLVTYAGASDDPRYNDVTKIDSDKFVTVWRSVNDSQGYVIAATVSGTTPTFGTAVSLSGTDDVVRTEICAPEGETDKFVVVYRNITSPATEIVAGTVSGTTVTMGTAVDLNPSSVLGLFPACSFINNNDVVAIYADDGDGQHGYATQCSVDWTDRSITCNSDEEFHNNDVNPGSQGCSTGNTKTVNTVSGYGTSTPKVEISYNHKDASNCANSMDVGTIAATVSPITSTSSRRIIYVSQLSSSIDVH